MGGSNGELHDLTNELLDRATTYEIEEVGTETSKIITTTETTLRHMLHERPEVKEGDEFQVPGSNPVQEWHLLKSLHQGYLSNGSNSQIKDDLVVQHH